MLLKMQAHARKTHRDRKIIIQKLIAENVKYLASLRDWNSKMQVVSHVHFWDHL